MLAREGGYTVDAGGPTQHGVTIPFLRDGIAAGLVQASTTIRDVDVPMATLLYRGLLWEPMKCDQMPEWLALWLLDTAVQDGRSGAVRLLQGILGVERDGVVGPKTLGALADASPEKTVVAFCDRRLEVYLASKDVEKNMRGWMRRLFRVEAESLVIAAAKNA